jgi:hypothetical protein
MGNPRVRIGTGFSSLSETKVALALKPVIDRLSLFCALRPNLDPAALRKL